MIPSAGNATRDSTKLGIILHAIGVTQVVITGIITSES